ncbi:MAG: hypothetical protein ACC663_00750 [Gammaproteobacteria bacterium]
MIFHFKQWLSCLKQYLLICLFISGPERLSYSLHCILFSLLAYSLLGFSLVDEQRSYAIALAQIFLELGLLALVAHVGLKWKKKQSRFHQTFSALVGVNLVISAVSIPVYQVLSQNIGAGGGIDQAVLNATLLVVFWNLAVLSLIFKRAFEINTVLAAMISFNYFLLYQFIIVWFL